VALMRQRNFDEKDFALFHPGGSLGERVSLQVKEIMRPTAEFPLLSPGSTVKEFLQAIQRQGADLALVLNPDGTLAGMITDRDLRRGDVGSPQFFTQGIGGLMNSNLPAVEETSSAAEALRELTEKNLEALPVLDPAKQLKGMVTLRDILNRKSLKVF
jgi:arabinose-5-phosphate isomerase